MKVAVIGWELPPVFSGGLGIHTFNLFSEISKIIDVDLYVPKLGALYSHYPFNVITVDMGLNGAVSAYTSKLDFYDSVMKYNKALEEVSTIQGANIVHCHDWITFQAGIRIKERFKVPLIVTVHSTEIDRSGNFFPQRWIMDIEQEGLREANKVITVSHYTKKMIVNTYNIDPDKITVIHNGVGKHFLELYERGYSQMKRVLYFGRITAQKGPSFFLEAASKAISALPEIKFIIAGTGDLLESVMEEARKTLPHQSYAFTGFVDVNEAIELYRESDAFVLPAVSEPFGITVLEAMSSGTPAIISKTTGVGESLRNVLKADFWDTDLIAEYIVGTVKYHGLRSTLGNEGMHEARQFTWKRAAEQTLGVYMQV